MPEKVLVVDDEHDIADLLEVYLQNENYIVYKFYSAREALDCIENQEVDLAILDIMLPDVNGFSICQKIREKYTYVQQYGTVEDMMRWVGLMNNIRACADEIVLNDIVYS